MQDPFARGSVEEGKKELGRGGWEAWKPCGARHRAGQRKNRPLRVLARRSQKRWYRFCVLLRTSST